MPARRRTGLVRVDPGQERLATPDGLGNPGLVAGGPRSFSCIGFDADGAGKEQAKGAPVLGLLEDRADLVGHDPSGCNVAQPQVQLHACHRERPAELRLGRPGQLVGRVVEGIDKLSVLPRGTGALGFYEKPEQRVPIRAVRVAADVPVGERTHLEALRTDSATFRDLVEARRFRRDDWYKVPAGHIDLCNAPLPVRAPPK